MNFDFEAFKYKTEAHCHTKPVSRCSEIPPEELVKAYKSIGVDAVVITNHFTPEYREIPKKTAIESYMSDFYKASEAGEKYGVKVILGTEIRFSEGINDYLVYGINEDFMKEAYDYLDTGIEKFYCEMKNSANVILQAHPFRNGMTLINPKFLDGIEAFNMHLGHNSRVAQAYRYAAENGDAIITAGTDFHHPTHEGTGLICSSVLPSDSFEFAELLKSKDYIFLLGGCPAIPYNAQKKLWRI